MAFRLFGACGIRVAGQSTLVLLHPEQATKGVCFLRRFTSTLALFIPFDLHPVIVPTPSIHPHPPGLIYGGWNCPHPLYILTLLTGFNYVPIRVCRPNRGAACAAAHHVSISCRIHLDHVPLQTDISVARVPARSLPSTALPATPPSPPRT